MSHLHRRDFPALASDVAAADLLAGVLDSDRFPSQSLIAVLRVAHS